MKHALMVGMMGRVADRFHEYQPARDLRARLDLARRVEGADGIEIVYPTEFTDAGETVRLLRDTGMPVSAVNLNVKADPRYRRGSFTNPDPRIRRHAVAELIAAMDLAAELRTSLVSCCPLIDGHNYSFEADYLAQWGWLQECISEGCRHRSDIRIALEYKLNESRNANLLSDVGRTLFLCERVGVANVGVTMDAGHALIARETPAESLCLASLACRLFYVHLNDNARDWDWDMIPGSVNFWDLLETVYYLKRIGWRDWIAYDIVVRDGDMVQTMAASIAAVKAAERIVDRIGMETIAGMIREDRPDLTMRRLMESLA